MVIYHLGYLDTLTVRRSGLELVGHGVTNRNHSSTYCFLLNLGRVGDVDSL